MLERAIKRFVARFADVAKGGALNRLAAPGQKLGLIALFAVVLSLPVATVHAAGVLTSLEIRASHISFAIFCLSIAGVIYYLMQPILFRRRRKRRRG